MEAYCGRWACANTEYAIKSIPFMLATPLMAILNFFISEGDHQTVTPPSIHREGIPNAFYASSVLIYIIRVLFACGVLTPLTLYTTKNRWPHIVPQLIGRFQEALSTTIFHIPTLAVQHQALKDTVPLESLLNFLYCIIQKECKQLNDHHHHIFYSQRAQQTPTNDQQLLDNLVAQDQPLPQTIRQQVFAPRVSPSIPTYTAEQLLNAFYVPDSVPTITAIHNLRYTISIPQTASSEASSYQPTTETSNITPEQTITTHSESSAQPPSSPAYELPDIQELSLSDNEMQNHSLPPQRIITPHMSIPSVNMENPPPENTNITTPPQQQTIERDTREVIIHEVRQLLEQQFIPHIARTVQTTLQTAQQQGSEPQRQSQQPTLPSIINTENQQQFPTNFFTTPSNRPSWPQTITHQQQTQMLDTNQTSNQNHLTNASQQNNVHSSEHWADTVATAVAQKQKPKPIDLDAFLDNTQPPLLTENDMERFARKTTDRITEADTRFFADQLEQFLLHDQTNASRVEEGRALRKLAQYTHWKVLSQWLQLYANPTYTFTFPKREFWRKKYDENAHRCMPQPRHIPDINDSLDRLARSLEAKLIKPETTTSRPNNLNNRNRQQNYNQNNQYRNNNPRFNNQSSNYNNNNYRNNQQMERHNDTTQQTTNIPYPNQTNNNPSPYSNNQRQPYQNRQQRQDQNTTFNPSQRQNTQNNRQNGQNFNQQRQPNPPRNQQATTQRHNNINTLQEEIDAILQPQIDNDTLPIFPADIKQQSFQ